jgi:mono/diheme cytochrome c family protein
MKRVIKWLAIGLAGLVGLVVVAVAVMYILANARLNKQYDIQVEPVAITADAAAIERGSYLYSVDCAGCHGDDLGGSVMFDDPAIGRITAPNLTGGQGGVAGRYNDDGYIKAIRHGVDSDGRPLLVMPSRAYWHFSDEDVAAIIAYIQSVPPVDNPLDETSVRLMGRVLVTVGLMDVLAAEAIDHDAQRPAAPEPVANAAYGEYLVNTGDCRACHGPDLTGGQPPEPGARPAPNLTATGELAGWTAADFLTAMRTGATPSGYRLDPEAMPWEDIGRLSEDDLTAIFLYLQSQPAQASRGD